MPDSNEDCPTGKSGQYPVSEQVCWLRMKNLETRLKLLIITSAFTIVMTIVGILVNIWLR